MELGDFLSLLNPGVIYQGGIDFSKFIAATITPVILMIALWLRISKTQLETLSGQGRWGVMIKDMAIWLVILGLYFGIADLLTDLFNVIYAHFQQQGSYSTTMSHFDEALQQIDLDSEGSGFNGLSFVTAPLNAVAFVIYYVSFLITGFVTKFLAMGHALAYSFAVAWGLIAIPMSLTSTFKLLRGWGVMLGTILLWPIVHYAAYAFFDPIFVSALGSFSPSDVASVDKAQLYSIMTIVNLLTLAITLSSPFVALALASNSGSITGVVAPFAAAAVAAGGAMAKQSISRLGSGSRMVGNGLKNEASRILSEGGGSQGASGKIQPESGSGASKSSAGQGPTIKSESSGATAGSSKSHSASHVSSPTSSVEKAATHSGSESTTPSGDAPSRSAELRGNSSGLKTAAVSNAVSASVADSGDSLTEHTPEVQDDIDKRKQARRGAIINQQKMKTTT